MRISLHSSSVLRQRPEVSIAEAQRAADAGLAGYWAPMLGGLDTLTMLALIGLRVPQIDLGTAVTPIPVRTPYALAQQARTIQMVSGGRLSLGLGTSHPAMVRNILGGEWNSPLTAMTSYIGALRDLLAAGSGPAADLAIAPPPILIGAVNPGMAAVATDLADGIVTWSAGRRTLEEVIRPAIAERDRGADFRVVVCLPLAITTRVDEAREQVQHTLGANDRLPSYENVLLRERASGIADVSLIGDEELVAADLLELEALGVTEFAAHIVGSVEDHERTWAFLSQLPAERTR